MKDLTQIENEVDALLNSQATERTDFDKLMERIESSGFDPNAQYYYLLGLLRYHCPNRDIIDRELSLNYFRKCVELDGMHYFAYYHLGFILFDKHEYLMALEIFSEKIDPQYFLNNNLKWRYFKIKEMRHCCELFLAETESEFCDTVVNSCYLLTKISENEEPEEYSFPDDLINTVYALVRKKGYRCNSLVYLAQLIKDLDLDDYYHREYQTFIALN